MNRKISSNHQISFNMGIFYGEFKIVLDLGLKTVFCLNNLSKYYKIDMCDAYLLNTTLNKCTNCGDVEIISPTRFIFMVIISILASFVLETSVTYTNKQKK